VQVLPNLIIIGAAKAGTTSLHYYLDQHPEVHMARRTDVSVKEMSYFWREDWYERRQWYESHFDVSEPVRGEASPAYSAFAYHPDVPRRIHELIPDARLIYLVRDPIERIVSHWVQLRADGVAKSFSTYMKTYDDPSNRIVCPSRYYTQLREYLRYYSPDQIQVIDQRDLLANRAPTLRRVFRFIGADEHFDSEAFAVEQNTRAEKHGPRRLAMQLWNPVIRPVSRLVPQVARRRLKVSLEPVLNGPVRESPVLDPAMRRRLGDHLRGEVEGLREFTGQAFATWSL
jgi:Sulfotransferase domain